MRLLFCVKQTWKYDNYSNSVNARNVHNKRLVFVGDEREFLDKWHGKEISSISKFEH